MSTDVEKGMHASFLKWVFHPLKRDDSNKKKITLRKQKLQHASSAVKDKLKRKIQLTVYCVSQWIHVIVEDLKI
jgi:hypothetical protein